MRTIRSLAACLTLTASVTAVHAQSSTEYKSNLTQIQVNQTLHTNLSTYIANSSNRTAAQNVGIAILDGRADANHVDLKGRLTVIKVYSGSYRRTDKHGTHVAGIAGASQNNTGIVGVAPTAKLYSIPVFDDYRWVASDLGARALNKAQEVGAKVVNMSYGPTTTGDIFLNGELDLFDNYTNSMVLVRAAGNSGANALNEFYQGDASSALAHLLIVGSVNSSNQISSFSNRPGEACIASTSTCAEDDKIKNFFIVAPGENILSDLPGNKYGTMSGTSMAAPHVTGAAALVFQNALAGNTLLTPAQVADILKRSATDLGARGVDGVFGWGLLNVTAALGPVGSTVVATGGTVSGSSQNLTTSTVRRSSVMGRSSAFENALEGMVVFDDYGRGFVMNGVDIAEPVSRLAEDAVSALSSSLLMKSEVHETEAGRLSLIQTGDQLSGFSGFSFSSEGYAISTGAGNSAAYFTQPGAAVEDTQSRKLGTHFFTGAGDVGRAFTSGFFSGADIEVGPSLTFSALYARGAANVLNAESSWTDSIAEDSDGADFASFGAALALGEAGTIGVNVGILREEDAMLGVASDGAFSLGDTAYTQMVGVSYARKLSDSITFDAFAQLGLTGTTGTEDSIFSSVSDVWSTKMGVSLTGTGILQPRDALQVSLVSPWRIIDGDVDATVAVGREFDGTVNYEKRRMSLAAGDLPLDLGLSYMLNKGSFSYGASLWLRDNDIETVSVDEAVAAAGLSYAF